MKRHGTSPPPGNFCRSPPVTQLELEACILENKRLIFERENDQFLEAYLQTEKVPFAPFEVPSDDEHVEEDLTLQEKWDIAKRCQQQISNGENVC